MENHEKTRYSDSELHEFKDHRVNLSKDSLRGIKEALSNTNYSQDKGFGSRYETINKELKTLEKSYDSSKYRTQPVLNPSENSKHSLF